MHGGRVKAHPPANCIWRYESPIAVIMIIPSFYLESGIAASLSPARTGVQKILKLSLYKLSGRTKLTSRNDIVCVTYFPSLPP
jgi:hypothetical protein